MPKSSNVDIDDFRAYTLEAASKYLVGYSTTIEQAMVALLAGGHVLLVGLPGLGKTLFVRVLASLWGLDFGRIQFTPDLLPSDITGTEILQELMGSGASKSRQGPKSGRSSRQSKDGFEFRPGPVFANLVLADEINRTPPKTQSALLQAMEERRVSIGQYEHLLPEPFMVLATQNPIELEGTYPLPEAQLDRFFLSLEIGYPQKKEEMQIALLDRGQSQHLPEQLFNHIQKNLLQYQKQVDEISVPESVLEGLVDSIRRTRPNQPGSIGSRYAQYGAGPRATQHLVRAARALALLRGESIVTEELVREVFLPVLRHRIILNYSAMAESVAVEEFLNQCLVL